MKWCPDVLWYLYDSHIDHTLKNFKQFGGNDACWFGTPITETSCLCNSIFVQLWRLHEWQKPNLLSRSKCQTLPNSYILNRMVNLVSFFIKACFGFTRLKCVSKRLTKCIAVYQKFACLYLCTILSFSLNSEIINVYFTRMYWYNCTASMSQIQTDIDPKHAQLGSCLDSELASPWPQNPVGPKSLPCHVLYGAGHCLGRTQVTSKRPVAHGNIWFRRIWMYRCRLMALSITTSSPLPMVDCTPYHD